VTPKPVASASKFAIVGGRPGGTLDSKGALKLHTGDYEKAAKLLALMHYGIKNSMGDRGRIAGISVTILFESDFSEKETVSLVALKALQAIGVPPIPEAKKLRFNGRF